MNIVMYCSGCQSCIKPCKRDKDMSMLKIGDRVSYKGKNAEIVSIWHDDNEYRVEMENLTGGEVWVARMASVELLSPSKQKKKTKK